MHSFQTAETVLSFAIDTACVLFIIFLFCAPPPPFSRLLPAPNPFCLDCLLQAVKKKCFIGQPVWLGTHGVLRIALGAPVTRCWGSEEGMAQCLKDDNYILHKWALVTKYFKELSC